MRVSEHAIERFLERFKYMTRYEVIRYIKRDVNTSILLYAVNNREKRRSLTHVTYVIERGRMTMPTIVTCF